MLYEVRIYDCNGNLKNTISAAELEKRSADYVCSLFTKRDREHIMSLEDEEPTNGRGLHHRVA